jgi:hypothetical protein
MYISSNDSTNGDPKVSGSQNAEMPPIMLIQPKISNGNASNDTSGK